MTWAAASGGVSGITSSADGTAMTIDSSERIVMPSQPMFSAHSINSVSGGSLHSSSNYVYNDNGSTSSTIQAVAFKNIKANVGSCRDNSTGVFTCPIAGRYYCYFNVNYHVGNAGNGWPNSQFMHNNYIFAQAWTQTSISGNDQYSNLVSSGIIVAAANETLWPGYHSGYNAPNVAGAADSWGYNQCIIMLLG